MVSLETAIQELNHNIRFNSTEEICTTPGEVVIYLKELEKFFALDLSVEEIQTLRKGLDLPISQLRRAFDDNSEPLPPCPFCGGEHILFAEYQHTAGPRWKVMCADCMAEIDPGWAQQPHALIPMWKRRASDNRIHAKWIDASAKSNCGKKCSHCGARITNREYVAGTHPFCHKCGAVMDNATEIQDKIKRMVK